MQTATTPLPQSLAVTSAFGEAQIMAEFERQWPELQSRVKAVAAATRGDAEEHEAEALSFCWRNFRQAARRGRWIPPGLNAMFAWSWIRSGRSMAGGSSITDPLDPRARWMGRAKVISLVPYLRAARHARHGRELPSDTARLESALTTSERQGPLARTRIRIDWGAFAATLDARQCRILHGLAIGERQSELAKRLGISPGRIHQILDQIGERLVEFYGEDVVPGGRGNTPHCAQKRRERRIYNTERDAAE